MRPQSSRPRGYARAAAVHPTRTGTPARRGLSTLFYLVRSPFILSFESPRAEVNFATVVPARSDVSRPLTLSAIDNAGRVLAVRRNGASTARPAGPWCFGRRTGRTVDRRGA
jgi:hypothetical protein